MQLQGKCNIHTLFLYFVKYKGFRHRAGYAAKPIPCFDDDVDYIGRDVNSCSETLTKSPDDCQFLCQDDPKCNFFVWIKSSHRKKNQCCLKQRRTIKMKRRGMISGSKYCPGNYHSGLLKLTKTLNKTKSVV